MKPIAIIPARFGSSRFPGKPLALLGKKPMLQHVYENVKESGLFDKILVATDDDRIKNAAESWGAQVVITSENHPSGTDRCAEAVELLDEKYNIVVNIQGDEPFINRKPLAELLHIFETNPDAGIATLVHKIKDPSELWDENTAKVVLGKASKNGNSGSAQNLNGQRAVIARALYFSRSPIPFIRSAEKSAWLENHTFWKHIGLYAYKPEVLKEIVKLPVGVLEKAESLEQLRWLENGYTIHVAETDYTMLSVDTQSDLEKAENFLNKRAR
jgi:3-deoxy-manno-octulosonate cytidylyltransferase (CMP-KDO synthetase)